MFGLTDAENEEYDLLLSTCGHKIRLRELYMKYHFCISQYILHVCYPDRKNS